MEIKCISVMLSEEERSYDRDMSQFLTINKVYETIGITESKEDIEKYYLIEDDEGVEHHMPKYLFEEHIPFEHLSYTEQKEILLSKCEEVVKELGENFIKSIFKLDYRDKKRLDRMATQLEYIKNNC